MNTLHHVSRTVNRLKTGLISQNVPNELIYFVTNVCNFRCKHCFNRNLDSDMDDLRLEEIEKILFSIKSKKILNLLISGGEPFIRGDLVDIISLFVTYCDTSKIVIPTNGYLTDKIVVMVKEMSRKHSKVSFRINISLDGMPGYHNSIRGNERSFENSINAIKQIQALNIPNVETSTICTITNDNLHSILDFQEYLNKMNIEVTYNIGRTNLAMLTLQDGKYIRSPYVNNQTPEGNGIFPDKEPFIDLVNSLYQLKKKQNFFRKLEDKVVVKGLLMGNEFFHGGRIKFECPAGKRVGVIYANGDVALCENYKVVGNLRSSNYDFVKVWTGEVAEEQRQSVPRCTCAHPCFIHPSLMRRFWGVVL